MKNPFIVSAYKKQPTLVESYSSNSDFDDDQNLETPANCSREILANRKL